MIGASRAILAAVLLAFACHVGGSEETQVIARVSGQITVDADGKAKQVRFDNVKDAKLRKFFTDKIMAWPFYPVTVDGKSMEATVGLSFNLIATYHTDKTLKQIEFSDVQFEKSAFEVDADKRNGATSGKRVPLIYPLDALRSGSGGTIVVALDIGPDGKVRNAAVVSAMITNTENRNRKAMAEVLGKNAVTALSQAEFTQAELTSRNCQNGCIAKMNAVFHMPQAGFWQSYAHVPVEPALWVVASAMKDIDESEQSKLVRLKDDPTGKPIEIGG